MSAPRHTPAPWRLAESHERGTSGNHYVWADAYPGEKVPTTPSAIATVHVGDPNCAGNARLIVAAPEMLAMLKRLSGEFPVPALEVAALIAKAEGSPRDQDGLAADRIDRSDYWV